MEECNYVNGVKHGKACYYWKAGHKEEFLYEKVRKLLFKFHGRTVFFTRISTLFAILQQILHQLGEHGVHVGIRVWRGVAGRPRGRIRAQTGDALFSLADGLHRDT